MTVICYRDGTLAADTLILTGYNRVGHCNKIERAYTQHGEEFLVGVCGTIGALRAVVNWVELGADTSKPIEVHGMKDFGVLIVTPDGDTLHADDNCLFPTRFVASFAAIGHGADVATMAMHIGADAVAAVRYVMVLDATVGGNVNTLGLDGSSDLALPNEIYKSVNLG